MTNEQSGLAVLVDGVALPNDAARDMWKKFSDHMGEHRGDLAGFAKNNGFFSIVPEHRNGKAVLVAYTKEPPRVAPPAKKKNRRR